MSWRAATAALAILGGLFGSPSSAAVRINGSTTVNPIVFEAAGVLRALEGLEILVDTVGGSSGGIAALGDGRVDIGMSSRPLNAEDRRRFPQAAFQAVRIGVDALALVVSKDVWEGGIRDLARDQVQALYEGRVRNWQELGGPDRRVVFFNKEPGRGTWEVFARWLYGSVAEAPLVSLPEVGSNEEARNKVASTPGAVTQLSAVWADNQRVYALAIRTDTGHTVAPTGAHIADRSYPLSRSLFVITNGPAVGETRRVIEYLTGPKGQTLVRQHGFLSISELVAGGTAP